LKLTPRTLFGRSAVTIALTLVVFMIVSLGTAVYFIAMPMAERSADDFAAVIVSAAHTLETMPEELHSKFQAQLLVDHGLIVAEQKPTLSEKSFDAPYYIFFQQSLTRRAGQELSIIESVNGPLIWVDVPAHGKIFRFGFDRKRLGTNPPVVLIMAIGGGALLTWLVSLLEVRRVRRPLARLVAAVREVGRGKTPPVLPEDGAEEIAALARAFNRMSLDMKELAENRTVIVAGISHDLRTPLTRLQLAVEMLSEDSDPELVTGIRRDVVAMNGLIGQFLDFSKGLEDEPPANLDLWELIEGQAADLRRNGAEVRISGCASPCVYIAHPLALQRLLANLLENAAHYGGGAPVDVELHCEEHMITVRISDRGPGIPADQAEAVFRPFHRLDSARSERTGGSGLGLAIARQLAIKHGWTIELLPREGGGTVAKVELPIESEPS
jgi:two-component system osmolarity sensor histidine kinase EnvZ